MYLVAAALLASAVPHFDLKGVELGAQRPIAEIERTLGIKCETATSTCHGETTVAGIGAGVQVLVSAENGPESITVVFDSGDFDEMARAVIQKYGDPPNGQHIDALKGILWRSANGDSLLLQRYTSVPGKSVMYLATRAYQDRAEAQIREKRGDL